MDSTLQSSESANQRISTWNMANTHNYVSERSTSFSERRRDSLRTQTIGSRAKNLSTPLPPALLASLMRAEGVILVFTKTLCDNETTLKAGIFGKG